MRVLIAPDKFKGTLTAEAVAEAIAEGWRSIRPQDSLELLPISDGGDGFGELLGRVLGAEERQAETVDAAHRPLTASWWWEPERRLAIVESARVIGIALLPPGHFHPFELDTLGLGQLLRQIEKEVRPTECLIGIGGSATNDGGSGMARGVGWRFWDADGKEIDRWTELTRLVRAEPPEEPVSLGRIRVAVDVQNRLLGPEGATRVYGPQKGLRPEDFPKAEAALARLVEVMNQTPGVPHGVEQEPGSGAAGGLGYGLRTFLGAELVPGFALFAGLTGLEERIRGADIVVTGEGALDRTTLTMGKGVGGVAELCRKHRVPVVAVVGRAEIPEDVPNPFFKIGALVPDVCSLEEAMREPAKWLRTLIARMLSEWER